MIFAKKEYLAQKLQTFMFTLHEKCPNTEFFLIRIFLYSDQKKLHIWTLFTQCKFQSKIACDNWYFYHCRYSITTLNEADLYKI